MTTYPEFVRIVEVGPRDGLQNEKAALAPEVKIEFINRLSAAGLRSIEAGAFVSPKWVPQMADTDRVFAGIDKKPGVSYPVLVPNAKGMEAALVAGVKEVAVFAAASETFSQKNINCSIAESLERFRPVMEEARKHSIKVRGYVSCVMGCPYEGEIKPQAVAAVAKKLHEMGCYEISLGDTIGTGTPEKTAEVLQAVLQVVPSEALAVHFHDTYGRAIENITVALEMGIAVVDAATGGLGGCPYAPGASGNVATEKVLDLLDKLGIAHGIDKPEIVAAARYIRDKIEAVQGNKILPKNQPP